MSAPLKTFKGNEIPAGYVYDFMTERPLLLNTGGYAQHRSILYRLYVFCMFLFLIFALFVSFEAAILTDQKELFADAMHSITALLVVFFNLLNRRLSAKDIFKLRDIVLSGFYKYQGEELDEEARRILIKGRADVWAAQRNFGLLMGAAVAVHTVVFIILQGFLTTGEEYESMVDVCNPYLPLCMLLPFSTRGFLGWALGYLVNFFCVFLIYGTGCATIQIYIGCNMQLHIQLALLNHSISRIFERADRLYRGSFPGSDPAPRPLHLPEYQACLHKCIRANVEHYQHLKRFQEYAKRFLGSILLIITVLLAIGVGPRVYLLLQNKVSIGKLMTYTLSSFLEQFYGLYLCYYGQKVIDESTRLRESLYSISWYQGNKSFAKTFHIFMLMTKEPIKVKALPLNVVANMETYGDLVAAIYKISNLLRQSDKV